MEEKDEEILWEIPEVISITVRTITVIIVLIIIRYLG